jgi:hypothetical protein
VAGQQTDTNSCFNTSLLGNGRIEMIVPTFPTLLPDSTRQMARNKRPFLDTVLSDQFRHGRIFIVGPRSLDEAGLQDSLLALHDLHFGVPGKVFGNNAPFQTMLVHRLAQDLVFLLGPLGGLSTTRRGFHLAGAGGRLGRQWCIGSWCDRRFLVGKDRRLSGARWRRRCLLGGALGQ